MTSVNKKNYAFENKITYRSVKSIFSKNEIKNTVFS